MNSHRGLVRINHPQVAVVKDISGNQDLVIRGDSPLKLKEIAAGNLKIICTITYYKGTTDGFSGQAVQKAKPVMKSGKPTNEWTATFKRTDLSGIAQFTGNAADDQTQVRVEMKLENLGGVYTINFLATDKKFIRLNV